MRHHLSCLALALALAAPAEATYVVRTARHTYYVDVVTSSFRPIWGAWVTVSESGDHSAWIRVRADGYRDASGIVSISPQQQIVHAQARMEDPTVYVRLVDRDGHAISGAWIDQSQFGAGADEYRISIRMPAEGFTKFQRSDVRVDYVWAQWINVWGSDANRRVEITLPRRQMGAGWHVNVRVTIPSDAQLSQAAREAVRLSRFERLHAAPR
jgi:hypothetical protein